MATVLADEVLVRFHEGIEVLCPAQGEDLEPALFDQLLEITVDRAAASHFGSLFAPAPRS